MMAFASGSARSSILSNRMQGKALRTKLGRQRQRVSGEAVVALDTTLLFAAVALALIGWVMISSASIDYAGHRFGDPLFHSKRHLIYLVIASLCSVVAYRVPVAVWNQKDEEK